MAARMVCSVAAMGRYKWSKTDSTALGGITAFLQALVIYVNRLMAWERAGYLRAEGVVAHEKEKAELNRNS